MSNRNSLLRKNCHSKILYKIDIFSSWPNYITINYDTIDSLWASSRLFFERSPFQEPRPYHCTPTDPPICLLHSLNPTRTAQHPTTHPSANGNIERGRTGMSRRHVAVIARLFGVMRLASATNFRPAKTESFGRPFIISRWQQSQMNTCGNVFRVNQPADLGTVERAQREKC